MPSSIYFQGRSTSIPGSYSAVDTSGLEQVGLGASGVVAVIGTAEGGRPVQAISKTTDFVRISTPDRAARTFRSGDLLEASNMAFAPGLDANILGGAQQVVFMKVNPAVQASAVLANSDGAALTLTAQDWGAFTSQINVSLSNGSAQGKLVTLRYENVTETVDNLGGSGVLSLVYNGGGAGYSAITAGVAGDGTITANGNLTRAGLTSAIAAQPGSAGPIAVTATGSDAGKKISVYGLDGSGQALFETLVLVNGTVTGNAVFTQILGTSVSAAPAGNISAVVGATTVLSSANTRFRGVAPLSYAYVSGGKVTLSGSAASTAKVIIDGFNVSGTPVREAVTLNGTTPVQSALNYSQINALVLGAVSTSVNVTAAAEAAKASATIYRTVAKAADFFNARQVYVDSSNIYGFSATVLTTQPSQPLADLDTTASPLSIASPTVATFRADLAAIADWINASSQLVSAVASPGATGAPDNTVAPVYLAGGSEGAASFSDWQLALNQLKRIRVNTVVPLTSDPAVHAAVEAHCAYMCGIGRSERDAFLGFQNAAQTDVPSKVEALNQAKALGSKNCRVFAQAIQRYDSKGELREFSPAFLAVIAAGMQAGSPVGTSLTHKYSNVLSFRQSNSWNPTDDADELIQGGVMFLEQVDGVGLRFVRNNTTYLKSNNPAFSEGSVNEAVNFAVYSFRNQMETLVGQPGFSGTLNAAKGLAIGVLGLLVDQGTLTAWRALTVTLNVDVLEVSVQIAPVIGINFVTSTIHLVTAPQGDAAAA